MVYYAKSTLTNGRQPTVKEHLEKVSALAAQFGEELSMKEEAELAGLFHDFGKYSDLFQKVLTNNAHHVDHALPGAVFIKNVMKSKRGAHVVEAIAGHHDGLRNYLFLTPDNPVPGKNSSIPESKGYITAWESFQQDFPNFAFHKIADQHIAIKDRVASMLYTRLLFSCLVDADYSISASDDDDNYLNKTTDYSFQPKELLFRLNAYREEIRKNSTANKMLNIIRDTFYDQCGDAGANNSEGLFTLTGPTRIGKTIALMHFSLRHCLRWNKKRIIVVLPFLSLTEQTVKEYSKIADFVLEDTSQVQWTDETKEYSSRWSSSIIVTTSVKFFEALFSDQPTECRKIHNIANSVILFDEAQSLPNELLGCTLQAVEELCKRYHSTMVFSTATQPDYHAILHQWHPTEIYPDNAVLFQKLKRVNVSWQIKDETALSSVAQEMAIKDSVCAIVNLRKHARELFESLISLCSKDECFFLTTDLCSAHRSNQIQKIKDRIKKRLPCRVVATQCIEAGVDLDFDIMYRALAPLEAVIQAAGRCNRNGRILEGGEVVVFIPACKGSLYPGDWYKQGAGVVAQMYADKGDIDINNPDVIRAYYHHLFRNQQDKQSLSDAINERDYGRTQKEYCLIENNGVQVIVPYGKMEMNYDENSCQLLKEGLSRNQMRSLAPYTVTCTLPKDKVDRFAELVPLPEKNRNKNRVHDDGSGYYVLRPQCLNTYTSEMGLQPFKEESDSLFL